MLIEAIILPLIIGKIRGGSYKKLLDISIKFWWLITIAGLIEFSASYIRSKEIVPLWSFVDQNVIWIQGITYILLLIVIAINYKEKGFLLLLIGILLNFIVIMANQGRMPIDVANTYNMMSPAVIERLSSGKDLIHGLVSQNTHLKILADIIQIPKPYPLPKSISIGDVFLIIGLYRFLYCKMVD